MNLDFYGWQIEDNTIARTYSATDLSDVCPGFRGGAIPQPTPPMPITGKKITVELKGVFDKAALVPERILRSGPATIVFWRDGTKTVVKRAPDEPDNAYAAFTAALGIKAFGSNSALKRIVERYTEEQKK